MTKKKTNDGYADLHVHTTFSDGMFTPEKVVETALAKGLKAIAITDHDCIDGIAPALKAARGKDLDVIPGVELSAAAGDSEIHILGYFLDYKCPVLVKKLSRMRENRTKRIMEMIKRLGDKGISIDTDKVFEAVTEGTIGRMHLARAMVDQKFAATTKEVFEKYLGNGKPCNVRHERLDYTDAISMIRKAGGVPVLAHPGNMGKDEFIQEYVKAGIMGIEVFHTEHRPSVVKKYGELASEKGLIMTGGSDCHGVSKRGGKRKGKLLLGNVRVGEDVVKALKAASEEIRKNKS